MTHLKPQAVGKDPDGHTGSFYVPWPDPKVVPFFFFFFFFLRSSYDLYKILKYSMCFNPGLIIPQARYLKGHIYPLNRLNNLPALVQGLSVGCQVSKT